MGQPGLFFIYFRSFQTNSKTILQQLYVKKCPSSIWCRDSNPRPLERESLSITTRPGLPPKDLKLFIRFGHRIGHLCSYFCYCLKFCLTGPNLDYSFNEYNNNKLPPNLNRGHARNPRLGQRRAGYDDRNHNPVDPFGKRVNPFDKPAYRSRRRDHHPVRCLQSVHFERSGGFRQNNFNVRQLEPC